MKSQYVINDTVQSVQAIHSIKLSYELPKKKKTHDITIQISVTKNVNLHVVVT